MRYKNRTKPTTQQKKEASISRRQAMENRNRKNEERRRNRVGGKNKEPHLVNTDRPQPTSDLRK